MSEAGLVTGMDMTPEAALTKLAYLLSQETLTQDVIKRLMGTNLRGELTEALPLQTFIPTDPFAEDADARTDEMPEFHGMPSKSRR